MAEVVSFHPTKKLFIDVLTRDISIRDCILDLLDNSVDSYVHYGWSLIQSNAEVWYIPYLLTLTKDYKNFPVEIHLNQKLGY